MRTPPSSCSPAPRGQPRDPDEGKKGGKLTVLSAGDVDYIDPGETYYTYGSASTNAIHAGSTRTSPATTLEARPGPRRRRCRRSPRTARPSR